MSRTLMTGNAAAAWGARLARADYVPAFPITPQTEIIETLAGWIDSGEMPGRLVTLESEHSMITAAGGAAATGVRVFSATSSQCLLYGMEMLYTVAGWRAPFVLVNVSRGLSAPITLEPDHNDLLAARDSGFLLLHCAGCQEVLDTVLMAYRLGEDPRVRLPVLVNLDGFFIVPAPVTQHEVSRRRVPEIAEIVTGCQTRLQGIGRLALPVRQQHDELLATVSIDDVFLPNRLSKLPRDDRQHFIADIMAVFVVDRLEVVEIEDADGESGAGPVGPGFLLRQTLHHVAPVEGLGQVIARRHAACIADSFPEFGIALA